MGALGNLIPLVILFAFVGGFAWVGYQMYVFANDLGAKGKAELQARNMHFTNEGMRIGVKEMRHEDYEDKTQSFLVNMWNHASFPGYKSRLWNTQAIDAQSKAVGIKDDFFGKRQAANIIDIMGLRRRF